MRLCTYFLPCASTHASPFSELTILYALVSISFFVSGSANLRPMSRFVAMNVFSAFVTACWRGTWNHGPPSSTAVRRRACRHYQMHNLRAYISMKYTCGSIVREGGGVRLPPSTMVVYETERHRSGRAAVTTGGLVSTMEARSTRTYLSACRHAHKLLTFVRKGNHGWGGPLAFVVLNHFGLITVHNRHFKRSAERGGRRESVSRKAYCMCS